MSVPGSLFWPTVNGLSDIDGLPLAGGFISFFVVGTATPKAVYHDVDLTTAWTQPVELDETGRATIYLEPGGYSATVTDAASVTQPIDLTAFEDIGQTYFDTLNTGGPPTITAITVSGYTALDTDQVITVTNPSGTDPFILNLLPAADFIQRSLTIKNLGEKDIALTPDGFDTIDLVAGVYTIPGSVLPMCPSVVLTTNPGTTPGDWYIESGLGIV